jgi:hypothetical protein
MVHAPSGQWPFGKSKLYLKQSSLRRVRSSNLKLAPLRAELVRGFTTEVLRVCSFAPNFPGVKFRYTFRVGVISAKPP